MEAQLESQRRKAEEIVDRILLDPLAHPFAAAIERCGSDKELLMIVLGVLNERGFNDAEGQGSPAPDPLINRKIGSYKIHWRLGGGGSGHVYLATRIKEPHQQVAIKFLILRDGDNEEFRRRFLRERQIVALLNHPYIVKLFDADRTRDGRPYFAMEYVEGEDIDKYANAKRFTIRQRLDLFLKVCDAVQYLHSHLIVHRDLKPANLLVGEDGNPKVLDFGIAKLLRPELMDGELITMAQRHPLTAQYASPEQWEGGLVTSASDVYSLGVILFELLTGSVALPLAGQSYAEYQRLVCDGQVPLASKSVTKGHAQLCREANTAALAHLLSGDLDAILSKALWRDVNERYITVAALAEDIQRYLHFFPVHAHEDALWYRIRRFLRRNRSWTVSVSAASLALILGFGATLVQRNEARTQKVEAERQRALAVAGTERVNEMVRQQQELIRQLQQRLDNKNVEDQQLRSSIRTVLDQYEQDIRETETHPAKSRGAGPANEYVGLALARNYGLLGSLLKVSGDQIGARRANRTCVAILERALKAGDARPETTALWQHCRAELVGVTKSERGGAAAPY